MEAPNEDTGAHGAIVVDSVKVDNLKTTECS